MLADNVPAVQALGQCLFLPMLIIGGIAVPLASLPEWAQHVSAFFPGRYAVDAIQSTVTGTGLGTAGFSLLALLLIGAAGCVAGAKLFRWDAQQRFASLPGKAWIGVALMAWVAVGLAAERRGNVVARPQPESSGSGCAGHAHPRRRRAGNSQALTRRAKSDRASVHPRAAADDAATIDDEVRSSDTTEPAASRRDCAGHGARRTTDPDSSAAAGHLDASRHPPAPSQSARDRKPGRP